MNLLRAAVETLRNRDVPHALVGAGALAVHGVSRATADLDLLVSDNRVLSVEFWNAPSLQGASVRAIVGDSDDPLAGVVRLTAADQRAVDVIVGRPGWIRDLLAAAERCAIEDIDVPVVRPAGLILLKLDAGGPTDAWDVRALLESHPDADGIRSEVDASIDRLPEEAARLWRRLRVSS